MKKNNLILVAVVAVVAVAGLSFYATSRDDNNDVTDNNDTGLLQSNAQAADRSSSTYKEYAVLKGEDYDRIFIANMIAHHQGAVDMAELALINAKHQEIKDLATEILSAQTAEIEDMRSWQSQWRYPSSSGEMMVDHSAMGMMMDMDTMTSSLKELTGDEFDRQFLSGMIEHHQSAIDMAISGEINAYHEEVRSLTKAIVEAQSGEITQMKQWQQDWDYTN